MSTRYRQDDAAFTEPAHCTAAMRNCAIIARMSTQPSVCRVIARAFVAPSMVLSLACCATTTQQVTVISSVQTMAPTVEQPAAQEAVAFAAGPNVPLTLADAQRALQTYGSWQSTSLGSVWFPSVEQQSFEPYLTHGQWVQSPTQQLQWNSTLPWGGITFHYGRWVNVAGRWGWVYGDTFAPAWVDWRVADGYLGWAPTGVGALSSARWSWVSWESLFDSILPRRTVRGARAEILLGRSRTIDQAPVLQPGVGAAIPNSNRDTAHTQQFRTVIIQDDQAMENWQQLMELSSGPTIASNGTPQTNGGTGTAPTASSATRTNINAAVNSSARQGSFASPMWSDIDRARTPIVARYGARYTYTGGASTGPIAVPTGSTVVIATPSNTTAGSQFVLPTASPAGAPSVAQPGMGGAVPASSAPVFSGYRGTVPVQAR